MAGKGFNAKTFLINHTEKVIFGAAGLMALAFIGSAQWSTYKGTPQEITEKVAASTAALINHDWPEEDRTKYEMTQSRTPKQLVHDNLLNPISVSAFEMSTRFVATPWQGKEPLREPALLALEDAIADAGKVLIERPVAGMKPASDTEPGVEGDAEQNDGTSPPPENGDDEFASNRPQAGGLAGGELPGVPGRPGRGGGAMLSGAGEPAEGGRMPPMQMMRGMPGLMGPDAGGLPGSGDMSGMTAGINREGHGYKFVSVRAVFPLKQQVREYQLAMHAKMYEIAAQSFEVINFNIERQEQAGAGDEWSDWQAVDTQSAIDVLKQSLDPEPDIVSGAVTNNVMTMPLPPRIYGSWRKYVSHPRIDSFTLSDEDIQREVEFQSKLLEMTKESQKAAEGSKIQKGGFSGVVGDTRALQSQAFGGSAFGNMGMEMGMGMGPGMSGAGRGRSSMGMSPRSQPMSSMPAMDSRSSMNAMRAQPGIPGAARSGVGAGGSQADEALKKLMEIDDKDAQGKALKDYIQRRVTADGELLLFRYIDFDVEPGKSYRYRVRLVLNNPNFGHLASEANGEASVVAGETRNTEWSNTTKPVAVERDVYYFVKDVDSKRGRTRMSMFEWDTKLGTTVNAELELYPGQHVGGTAKTKVIDPAKAKVEEKEYEFKSSDVFVDTNSDVAIESRDRGLHKDLKLPGGSNGEALLPEQVLVVDAVRGELAVIDPVRNAGDQFRLEDQQKKQDKHFESEYQTNMGGGMAEGMGGLMGGDMSELYGSQSASRRGGGKGGRSRNPMAGAGGMPAGMMMPEGGMMPGGMMPGAGRNSGAGRNPGRGKSGR